MNGPLSEKWLLYKIVTKKDADAFAVIYNSYVERIYRFVYFKLGSREEAEDATNDIFLRTWHYLINGQSKQVKSVSGLLYTIARNVVVDMYRDKARRQTVSLQNEEVEKISSSDNVLEKLAIKGESAHIEKALRSMKQEYQEVILLHFIEELSFKEIAEMLGKNPLNVRVLLHRALKKLKEMLEKEQTKI